GGQEADQEPSRGEEGGQAGPAAREEPAGAPCGPSRAGQEHRQEPAGRPEGGRPPAGRQAGRHATEEEGDQGPGYSTVTHGRSCSSRFSPMPETSKSWRGWVKGPQRSRYSRIRWARAGPMPGRVWSKAASAVFRLIRDRKSTRLNSSHVKISYAVFCLKKKTDNYDFSPTLQGSTLSILPFNPPPPHRRMI